MIQIRYHVLCVSSSNLLAGSAERGTGHAGEKSGGVRRGGPFLCGGEYTLADCLFTCVLARLGMISMLGETFKTRRVVIGFIF